MVSVGELAMTKHKARSGCLQKVKPQCADSMYSHILASATKLIEGYACGPWLATARRWHYRFGPGSYPLVGMGGFLTAWSGHWLVLAFAIDKLLDEGITLSDFDNFSKAGVGVSFLGDHAQIIRMAPGEVFFLTEWLRVYSHVRVRPSQCWHRTHVDLPCPMY